MKTSVKILIAILCIVIIGLVGFIIWDKVINKPKTNEIVNTTNVTQTNVVTNSTENTNVANTANTVANKLANTSTTNATTPSKLVVSREGMQEEVPSQEYSSSYGYTIRYATDSFKVSNHDNKDWFERTQDINCVVVEKENVSYSKKLETLSNYKKTTVNGYEAVYVERHAEGQIENTYYINTGKDFVFEITTSCQGTTEYLEGIGHIMDAMVQTFAAKEL
jgi:hypothetical protein